MVTALSFIFAMSTVAAEPLAPGANAPTFSLPDLDGQTVSLEQFKGKTVVLEWFNPGCPFVVSAHEPGSPLADMATTYDGQVVWLAINSGAEGKQGHDLAENKAAVAKWSLTHPVLRDVDGTVGRAYGATTTPQMVVIKPDGTIGYHGALDNAPRNQVTGGPDRIPYTKAAIDAVIAGNPPVPARTKPWGCSVKY